MCESNQPINEENIIIQRLSNEEILSIYTTHSIRHFPADELKPASSVKRLAEDGIYIGYGLFEKENTSHSAPLLLCYAFFTVIPQRENILLDYFAVMEDYRSHGIGSIFLNYARSTITEYSGILIESENPDYAADEEELIIQNKRLDFYHRNGACFTGILAEICGVPYRLLYFPLTEKLSSLETLRSDFDAIYQHMVSQKNYEKYVRILMPE